MTHARVAVTHYCERTSDLFWAEPINAVTNLIFVLAAAVLIRTLRRMNEPFYQVWDLWLITVLLSAIGIGSFLWHTLANSWAELADVVPISLFITLFLFSFLVRILQFRMAWVVFWLLFFHAVNFYLLSILPSDMLNGSVFYLPTWIGLWVLVVNCKIIDLKCGNRLIIAASVFTISLVFRTVDQTICDSWPLGTHFLWHLLNGLTLYLVMNVLLINKMRYNQTES
ncbi:MAG: ceramidase domain-containing protein [Candidatus Thiodiazotropha sp. (ex Ctena orbiculata)]|nr:ceramidase domain-containing protein [Candidatus Thiodiazotropha taylori]